MRPKSNAEDQRMGVCMKYIHGGPKVGPRTAGRFRGKFAIKWLLRIPPLHAYVVTLLCETFMSVNQ